jgi:hypothetical protein
MASIAGCITLDQNGLSLTNEKDKKTYALSGDSAELRPGQQVALTQRQEDEGCQR